MFVQGDRESLELLHEIIHGFPEENLAPLQTFARHDEASSSSRAERRRSLPSRPSIASLSSVASSISPPEISAFEQKRRRANKLTNFFGVNHRDITAEILENMEKGVVEEGGIGTLNPEQVKVGPILRFSYSVWLIIPLFFRTYCRSSGSSGARPDSLRQSRLRQSRHCGSIWDPFYFHILRIKLLICIISLHLRNQARI